MSREPVRIPEILLPEISATNKKEEIEKSLKSLNDAQKIILATVRSRLTLIEDRHTRIDAKIEATLKKLASLSGQDNLRKVWKIVKKNAGAINNSCKFFNLINSKPF